MRIVKWVAGAVAVAAIAACGGAEVGSVDRDLPDPLTLGLVPSQDVDKLVEDAQILGDLIGAELGVEVTTHVATDYAALVVAMGTGQADVGMFGPIALVQAMDQFGAEVILQSVRRGAASYHTQWLTDDPDRFCTTAVVAAKNPEGHVFSYCNGTDQASSGPVGEDALSRLERGERILFVDASSASGYYYPATQIQSVTGMDPLVDIEAVFAGDHPSAVLGVLRGDAHVGVSFDDARNNLVREESAIGADVVVFAWSDEIPNDGVAVRGDLSADARQAIADAFTAVANTDDGAQALIDVYSIEGLVQPDLAALDVAREVAGRFAE